MPIEIPSELHAPSALNFQIFTNVQTFASTFTRASQSVELLGGHWSFSARWDIVNRDHLPLFRAFFASLRGGVEPFYFSDISHPTPAGEVAGDVEIVSGTTDTVTVSTTTPDTLIFFAGDYLEVPVEGGSPNEYKMVTADVVTDGTGAATITVAPVFRYPPLAGANIIYQNPRGLFTSVDNTKSWSVAAPTYAEGVTLNGIEWMV